MISNGFLAKTSLTGSVGLLTGQRYVSVPRGLIQCVINRWPLRQLWRLINRDSYVTDQSRDSTSTSCHHYGYIDSVWRSIWRNYVALARLSCCAWRRLVGGGSCLIFKNPSPLAQPQGSVFRPSGLAVPAPPANSRCVSHLSSGVARILLGGHERVAHGFRRSWWQSHPEVKAVWH